MHGAENTRADLATTVEGRPSMKTEANHRSSNTRRAMFTNNLKVSNPSPDSGTADGRKDAKVGMPSGTKVAIQEFIRKSKMRADKKVIRCLGVFFSKSPNAIRAIVEENFILMNVLKNKGSRGANMLRGDKLSQATNGGVLRKGERPSGEL